MIEIIGALCVFVAIAAPSVVLVAVIILDMRRGNGGGNR